MRFSNRPVHAVFKSPPATIVQDGENGHYQKNRETLRVEKRKVSPADTLRLKLAPGGGACVILEKSPAR